MYEYKVDIYKLKYAAEAMNAYAKEGWRVIAVSPDKQDGFVDVFFERVPVVEEKVDKTAEELEAAVDMIDTAPDEISEITEDTVAETETGDVPDSEPETQPAPEAVADAVPAETKITASTDELTVEALPYLLTICKMEHIENIDPSTDFFFIAKTDNEVSLVCETEKTPFSTAARDDGWKAFRVKGLLDLSLSGILAKMTGILADNGIGTFAVSTFDTDYILVKEENFDKALNALGEGGYKICK